MKRTAPPIHLVVLAAFLVAAGCGRKPVAGGGRLEKGFAQANPVVQAEVAKAAAALTASNYLEAVTTLDRLLQQHQLSDAEKQAVREAFGEITQAVAANPGLDTAEFYRARGELMKKIYGEF